MRLALASEVSSTARPPGRTTRAASVNTRGYSSLLPSTVPNCLPKGRSQMSTSTAPSRTCRADQIRWSEMR
eukprot:9471268-Pyramimonas_sp.AAC.1